MVGPLSCVALSAVGAIHALPLRLGLAQLTAYHSPPWLHCAAPVSVTAALVFRLTAMIERSDNNAAQLIYDTIGYGGGEEGYMRSWGITDYTTNAAGWGWAMWSPADMAHLLSLLQAGKVLNSSDRALAFHLMQSIESDQRFGVGDTAPDNATVAMKDGWVPGPDGSWWVNTSGIVTVGGEKYIITVYTGEQNSFGSGQNIVNHVCGAVAQTMV